MMLTPQEAMASYKRPVKHHKITISVNSSLHNKIAATAEAEGITVTDVVKSAIEVFFSMLDDSQPEKPAAKTAATEEETKPAARSRRRAAKPKPEPEPEDSDDDEDGDGDDEDDEQADDFEDFL